MLPLLSLSKYPCSTILLSIQTRVKALARTCDVLHLPLNSERLNKLTESYVVSNHKLKTALGIKKMPVTAEEGLKKTFESFQG